MADVPVYVVVPPRPLLLDVAGPIEVLRKANLVQDKVCFDVRYVGPLQQVASSVGLSLCGIDPLPAAMPEGALVVVVGMAEIILGSDERRTEVEAQAEAEIVAWLSEVIRPGQCLISICAGALLAARAGLLDGYSCTTHHACCAELSGLAPAATVLENRLFVEDRERLTSAGITAGIDLMLHLVAKIVNHACAMAVARFLVVYIRRAGGDPQLSPWLEGRNHLHPVIHRVQDAITGDPTRRWSLTDLGAVAHASPRHLSRLFNEQTGLSVTDFVNRIRVALARELLAGTRLDMDGVAERAGFGSARQLRRAWGRLNRLPPRDARPRSSEKGDRAKSGKYSQAGATKRR